MPLSRRDFLLTGTAAGALVGGGVLVPLGIVLADDDAPSGATGARLATFPRTSVGSYSDLTIGEPVFFDYPYKAASNLMVRTGTAVAGGKGDDNDLIAYSNLCTHMGCPITEYQADAHVLGPCPCHFSTFDLSRDGVVALGQATQSLPRLLLEVEDDEIFATGVFRLLYGHDDNLAGETLVSVGDRSGA